MEKIIVTDKEINKIPDREFIDVIINSGLQTFCAQDIAKLLNYKENTVRLRFCQLKREGKIEKTEKARFYRLTKSIKSEIQNANIENTIKGITIAVDDSIEVNMKREGGKTIYSFVLK